ncbi:hypothetical protein EV581_11443 [Bacillus sp. BK006]|nr:hypothetical protein EV581_11443 [Bacillus sp. BK006]
MIYLFIVLVFGYSIHTNVYLEKVIGREFKDINYLASI